MTALFSRVFTAFAFGLAALAFTSAQAASYSTLDPAQPSDSPGQVEVLEFFSYSCPHCKAIEPLVEKWAEDLPEGAVFKRVPVAFNAGMRDLQKLYYALEAIDRLDLHPLVFKALHDERKQLFEAPAITDWVAEQGVDRQTFTDAFDSFGVQTKARRADELTKSYEIDGTPSFAVGGQYVTSPSQTGSYQGAVDETDRLVKALLAGQTP